MKTEISVRLMPLPMPKHRSDISSFMPIGIFAIVLLAANAFWKLTIQGNEDGTGDVFWLGMNLTPLYTMLSQHTTRVVYLLVHAIHSHLSMTTPISLHYAQGTGISIIWGCIPIKQSFIFTCIMLASAPYICAREQRAWHKLWVIPTGIIAIYLFNIFRIAMVLLLIEQHPSWFEILHAYIFKYLFYAFLFAIWVIWEEKMNSSDKHPD